MLPSIITCYLEEVGFMLSLSVPRQSFDMYNFLIREKLSLLISWISARLMLVLPLPTIFLSWETTRSCMKALVLAY
jgi:hypothetical protein